ncbi:sn-glycerol-3-phosphate import ATP-binding protein UgpC [Acrocarpospora macrocephala]|uniref:sn-glycerol-3-phosphate import ATP-binding protein UgpC n=1 Tax=Acrocarpospora macrocephala TaxID=150177 RepID=A0A5M3WY74_9ACTN|nr:sn-glycerol-3-phosphate import ATP-binding protein UgpC [Acrocarpospora macrocephala]
MNPSVLTPLALPKPPNAVDVSCHNLVKRFPDGTVALDDVTIECPPGGITVLLGPSGCGKTTLLRCVAGLETQTTGTMSIGGRDVSAVDAGLRGVAMVFQNHALYPDKTAEGNLAFPLRMAGVPKRERARRVAAIAELLQIDGLLKRRPGQLSGGQRQRVGIGRALIREPDVLLMDEPFSSLDAELRVEMRAEFLALQRRLGMTTLYVTHDQAEALSLADRMVVLRAGRIEQATSAEEMFRRPATSFVAGFLGGMNLLAGTLDDGTLRVPGHPHGLRLPALPANGSQNLTLGVRPEDLKPGPGGPDDLSFEITTMLTELLGRERLVHGHLGDRRLKVRVHADVPVGERLTVHAAAADLHLFDHDGARLPGAGD